MVIVTVIPNADANLYSLLVSKETALRKEDKRGLYARLARRFWNCFCCSDVIS